jgi:hypothetical protein
MHGQRRQSRQRQSPPCGMAAHIVNSGQRQGDSTRARNHDGLQHSRQTIRPPTIGTAQLGAGSSSALPPASPAARSGWMHISSPGSGCMHRHTLYAAQWLQGAAAQPGHGHGRAGLPPMTMPGQGHTCTFPCIILAWPAQSCFACRESSACHSASHLRSMAPSMHWLPAQRRGPFLPSPPASPQAPV